MYIKDIKPIDYFGVNLLNIESPESLMDRIIEEPLKKPCKVFYKKGIQTVMSSANKNNIVPKGMMPKKKRDVAGRELFLDAPTFEDAGRGYAWIMLDFDSLSDENKDILFQLEERTDKKGNRTGEEAIWFVFASSYELFRYNRKKEGNNARSESFKKKAIILEYNNRYPSRTAIVRRPINEETTVEEVEEYFLQIAELLKDQRTKDKEIETQEDEGR